MFTGLIEATGEVVALEERGDSARLTLQAPSSLVAALTDGESVAVNGCCLTVTEKEPEAGTLGFDLLAQTLRVTGLGELKPGSLVNLERAMQVGDRFGGHFVQGHVDATGVIIDWSVHGQDHRLEIEVPEEGRGLLIPKGSICIDGISLTAAEVTESSVVCWIIPHTLKMTNLEQRERGQQVNLEFDMLGKYVRSLLQSGAVQG
jgi:riboflavin synthase